METPFLASIFRFVSRLAVTGMAQRSQKDCGPGATFDAHVAAGPAQSSKRNIKTGDEVPSMVLSDSCIAGLYVSMAEKRLNTPGSTGTPRGRSIRKCRLVFMGDKAKPLTSLNDLPDEILVKLQNHLKSRLGQGFYGLLKFSSGRQADANEMRSRANSKGIRLQNV
ncbi:MAG TPA: hypothetical protein PK529_13810 [Verrucomicrobiales bacterium]|nr:hypothetical protein [Verrucomicrobiales bacterium]